MSIRDGGRSGRAAGGAGNAGWLAGNGLASSSQGKNAGDRPLGSGGRPHITPPPRLARALTASQAAATVPVVLVKGP
eukprot:scaffold3392_cov50-Phaeocystis_antarctica.AAC.1